MKPVIIVPAYSRANSLNRLLNSINDAVYPFNDIELIISLDGGFSKDVLKVSMDYQFIHGNKRVIKRRKNLGLRAHILWCGDQTEEYGSVIVLEDDLIVGNQYYNYSRQALEYYKNDNNIAGISLYGHKYNEYAKLPFEPYYNGYCGYFMQIASSWGQAWNNKQWSAFKSWYQTNNKQESINNIIELPNSLKNWPESSWKKYYSAYLVKENKYYFYPYYSLTTNCTEIGGTHTSTKINKNTFQVPLSNFDLAKGQFNFCDYNNKPVKYDAFFEFKNINLYRIITAGSLDLCIDTYGIKPLSILNRYNYVLTSRSVKKYIKTYKLKYKPIETNFIIEDKAAENGEYLYLTRPKEIFFKNDSYVKMAKYYSNFDVVNRKFILRYFIYVFKYLFNNISFK